MYQSHLSEIASVDVPDIMINKNCGYAWVAEETEKGRKGAGLNLDREEKGKEERLYLSIKYVRKGVCSRLSK